MRRPSLVPLFLGLSSFVSAVYKDEVGVTDFHHALLGIPQADATFFHRPRKDDKASLLYTLSDLGVVGAVKPATGELVWRHQIQPDVSNGGGFLRAPDGEDWVAAALGSKVEVWSALTGRSIWNMEFPGTAKDLEIIEVTEKARKDLLLLSEEDGVTVVRRIHSGLGTVSWEFRETSSDIPQQISNNIVSVFVVSLHGSPSSYSIRATSLDPATGARVDQITIGTKGEVHGPEDVILVGSNSAAPIVAWANIKTSKLHIHVLGGKGKAHEVNLRKGTEQVFIHAPHFPHVQPHFLVHERGPFGDKGEVFHTNLKTGQVSSAYELPYLDGKGAFSISTQDANVYFVRIREDKISITSSDSHAVLQSFRIKKTAELESIHAVSEALKKPDGTFAVRSAIYNTNGNWILMRNGELDWSRPEGLSGAVAAVYAEFPESGNLAKALEQEAQINPLQAYIHRVSRHLNDLKYLPGWLMALPANIASGLSRDSTTKDGSVARDAFGFSKIIVVVTRRGRVYGLDTGNHGKVSWTKEVYPQPVGAAFEVKGILADDKWGIVKILGAKGEYATIQAVDGSIMGKRPAGDTAISSAVIVDGNSFLPLDSHGKRIEPLAQGPAPNHTIAVRAAEDKIRGVRYVKTAGKVEEHELWQFQVSPGRKIVEIATHHLHDPVASIGRVLGDRRVMYKYLNANSIVVAVLDPQTSGLSIQLIDTVSGQLLVSQTYSGVDGDKPVSCAIAENWYICTFFGQSALTDGTDRILKGYQIVASDLYESALANDRGSLGESSAFSTLDPIDSPTGSIPLPYVVSQAWIVSQPLTKLAVTQTLQGVSNRDIVAYLPETHSLVGIPRSFLDPRRPVGRDPSAVEMEAEGLTRYQPALEVDPRSLISHERDVIGVVDIVASPAIVESTGLLIAFGIDIYGTRISPSGLFDILGKGFDKVTLIGTVAALFVGVAFLAPMVRRNQINRAWEAPS